VYFDLPDNDRLRALDPASSADCSRQPRACTPVG